MFLLSHGLRLFYRYEGLAERLAAADRVYVGYVKYGVGYSDTEGNLQTHGEMPVAGCQIHTVGTNSLGDFQAHFNIAYRAAHLHQVPRLQAVFLGSRGVNPEQWFILVLV